MQPGSRLAHYEIHSLIGKGGMGEVYRARDTRLGRDVALKILPETFIHDEDRMARFRREAQVLGSLQHQNIASLYGLEDLDGRPVLAMELAEGEDLSERIAAGNLEGAEIDKIARQLARGLEFAHEKGIVHRDLKPANVKVHDDGQVKILDFGLARALADGEGETPPGSTPLQATVTQGLTAAGTVLGTAAYMSPEQARGYHVDRRSDIWAFGVIVYEMLTGVRLFEGETASDTLASILRQDPDWNLLPEDTNPLLLHICQRCLEKNPRQRMRDIGEVRIALEDGGSSVVGLSAISSRALPAAVPETRSAKWSWLLAGVLGVGLAVVLFLGVSGRLGPAPAAPEMLQATINLPEGVQLNLNPAAPGPVAVSPNGKHLVFSASDTTGQIMLYVRDLAKRDPVPIPGTSGGIYPFWSPDNRSVAFFTPSNKLARVDVAGGPVVALCNAENGKGGTWHPNGNILFAASHISSISMVPASGGQPVEVTNLRGDPDFRSHRFPSWLPDGRSFLFVAVRRTQERGGLDSELRQGFVDGQAERTLLPTQGSAAFSKGNLLYVHDNVLMARPFDPAAGIFTGPQEPILGDVLNISAAHLSLFSATDSGILAFTSGGAGGYGSSRLFRLDPATGQDEPIHKPLITFGFDYSPDGKLLALSLPDMTNGTFDIWILDLARDLSTRLTFAPESEMTPIFSPDGQWVVYASDGYGSQTNLVRKRLSGTGEPEVLLADRRDCWPTDFSPDGRHIAITSSDSSGRMILEILDLEDGTATPLHGNATFSEGMGSFSPDGAWLASMSDETGQMEVFVESRTPGGGRYRVSTSGGYAPGWSPEGDRLYYMDMTGSVLAVDISRRPDGGLGFSPAQTLADRVEIVNARTFTVNPVSGELIIQRTIQAHQNSMLGLVANWEHLLRDD